MSNLYKALFLIACSLAAIVVVKGAEYLIKRVSGTGECPLCPTEELAAEKAVAQVAEAVIETVV